jgi:hypothetical protein
MKYLEDTLAEQCLSKTLYPNTKIIVRRKKVEGTLMTYTNELEVEIDFSDVDPTLLEESKENNEQSLATLPKSENNSDKSINEKNSKPQDNEPNPKLGVEERKPSIAGRAARFFRRRN